MPFRALRGMKDVLLNMTLQLQQNPNLLELMKITPQAHKAMDTLAMLCLEIKDPLVWDFIQLHLYEDVNVLSKLSNNTLSSLHSSIPLISDTYSISSNAGVYA